VEYQVKLPRYRCPGRNAQWERTGEGSEGAGAGKGEGGGEDILMMQNNLCKK
jgi:hypothetical protein